MSCGSSKTAIALLMFVPVLYGADAIVVKPAHVYMTAAAGESITTTVDVVGPDRDVAMHIAPFTIASDGTPSVSSAAATMSIESWVSASYDASAARVTIRIKVPEDARGSRWGALMIDSGDAVQIRVAVPIIVTVAGTEVRTLETVSTTAVDEGDHVAVRATIRNTGNAAAAAVVAAALERAEATGRVEVAASKDTTLMLLPGGDREVTLRIPKRPGMNVSALVPTVFVKATAP